MLALPLGKAIYRIVREIPTQVSGLQISRFQAIITTLASVSKSDPSRKTGTAMSNSSYNATVPHRPSASVQLPATTSAILHATSRHHHWSGSGPLSIKTFPIGKAFYTVEGGNFLVDESGYLLLNAGQDYTVLVDSDQPVESFCVFFADGFAEEVYASGSISTTRLLDDPGTRIAAPLHFYDRSYIHDAFLSPSLAQLRIQHTLHGSETGWQEEMFHHLMYCLLHVHHRVVNEVAALPALRATTRDELYRRIHRVRDYIAASYPQPLTLNDMAQVACLSPNHLLRSFKQIFQQSPHQYLPRKTDRTSQEVASVQ